MPTITINAKATKQNDDLLFLTLEYQGQTIEMTVKPGMSLIEMAQLAINQDFPQKPDVSYDGSVEITFHNETVIDLETGLESIIRIVDSATKGAS